MKKNHHFKFLILSFSLSSLFFSCKDNEVDPYPTRDSITSNALQGEKKKLVKYKGIDVELPADYASDLFNYDYKDLQKIGNTQPGKHPRVTDIITTKDGSETVEEIIEKVLKKYPSFDEEFKAENYKKYFPKLTLKEIEANADLILDVIEKIIGYETAISISHLKNKKM